MSNGRNRGSSLGDHGRREQGRGEHDRRDQELRDLWSDYLSTGFLDPHGNLRSEYVKRSRVEPLVKAMSQAQPALTMHQARRFFQHCRAIEARLRARTSTWEAEEANLRKLDVAAADAFGKSQKKVPKLFHDVIRASVAAIKDEADFLKGFLPHFEAIIGFGSQHLRERDRN